VDCHLLEEQGLAQLRTIVEEKVVSTQQVGNFL
jgi:hypothetical protein